MNINANARLWLAALRSDKYPQSKHPYAWLRDDDGFTALGVLCEVAKERGVIDSYIPSQAIPPKVQKWAGIASPVPLGINFDAGTFRELAGTLEKRAGEVFISHRSPPFTQPQLVALRALATEMRCSIAKLKRDAFGTGVKGDSVIVPCGKRWLEVDARGVVTE